MSYVLLVDDDEESLARLCGVVEDNGFSHACAAHGAEALVKARSSPPSVVVADLLMPIMDGYTLLRQWKADAALKSIPFVVYTATYTDAEDEQLALDLGADAFICKFCEPNDLVARLRQLVGTVPRPRPGVR